MRAKTIVCSMLLVLLAGLGVESRVAAVDTPLSRNEHPRLGMNRAELPQIVARLSTGGEWRSDFQAYVNYIESVWNTQSTAVEDLSGWSMGAAFIYAVRSAGRLLHRNHIWEDAGSVRGPGAPVGHDFADPGCESSQLTRRARAPCDIFRVRLDPRHAQCEHEDGVDQLLEVAGHVCAGDGGLCRQCAVGERATLARHRKASAGRSCLRRRRHRRSLVPGELSDLHRLHPQSDQRHGVARNATRRHRRQLDPGHRLRSLLRRAPSRHRGDGLASGQRHQQSQSLHRGGGRILARTVASRHVLPAAVGGQLGRRAGRAVVALPEGCLR